MNKIQGVDFRNDKLKNNLTDLVNDKTDKVAKRVVRGLSENLLDNVFKEAEPKNDYSICRTHRICQ